MLGENRPEDRVFAEGKIEMRVQTIAIVAGLAGLLAACGNGGEDGGEGGGEVTNAQRDEFVAACTSSGSEDTSFCECVGDRAQSNLSADGFSLLMASVNEDEAEARRLTTEVGVREAMQVAGFMAGSILPCAGVTEEAMEEAMEEVMSEPMPQPADVVDAVEEAPAPAGDDAGNGGKPGK